MIFGENRSKTGFYFKNLRRNSAKFLASKILNPVFFKGSVQNSAKLANLASQKLTLNFRSQIATFDG